MGSIIKNGIAYAGNTTASEINYDDTTSQIGATSVQGAIEVISESLSNILGATNLGTFTSIGTMDVADMSEYKLMVFFLFDEGETQILDTAIIPYSVFELGKEIFLNYNNGTQYTSQLKWASNTTINIIYMTSNVDGIGIYGIK